MKNALFYMFLTTQNALFYKFQKIRTPYFTSLGVFRTPYFTYFSIFYAEILWHIVSESGYMIVSFICKKPDSGAKSA